MSTIPFIYKKMKTEDKTTIQQGKKLLYNKFTAEEYNMGTDTQYDIVMDNWA